MVSKKKSEMRVVLTESVLIVAERDEQDPESIDMPIFIPAGTIGTVESCAKDTISVTWDQAMVGNDPVEGWWLSCDPKIVKISL